MNKHNFTQILKYIGAFTVGVSGIHTWYMTINQYKPAEFKNKSVAFHSRTEEILGDINQAKANFEQSNQQVLDQVKEWIENLIESFNGGGNTSSLWGLDEISQMMSNYESFLETLNQNQKYAIIHILLSIIIFICIFSIVSLYLGDEIIKYFKLEERFPKIAKYIQLRRKFVTYNILLDALIIFLALIVIVGFNLYVLFYFN